jgi:hypothetical protein
MDQSRDFFVCLVLSGGRGTNRGASPFSRDHFPRVLRTRSVLTCLFEIPASDRRGSDGRTGILSKRSHRHGPKCSQLIVDAPFASLG